MKSAATKRPGRPPDAALRERRRAAILDAAAEFFARDGFHAADLQVLATRLQVGKGTIYRYFPSKERLFLAAVDRVMRRLKATVDDALADVADPLERLARAMRAYLEFFAAHPEFVELLIQERAEFKNRKKPTYFEHRDANLGPWRELFQGLIVQGRVRDVPVERIITVLGDLLYGTMFTNYFTQRRASFPAQAADILDIVFHGILTERSRDRQPRRR